MGNDPTKIWIELKWIPIKIRDSPASLVVVMDPLWFQQIFFHSHPIRGQTHNAFNSLRSENVNIMQILIWLSWFEIERENRNTICALIAGWWLELLNYSFTLDSSRDCFETWVYSAISRLYDERQINTQQSHSAAKKKRHKIFLTVLRDKIHRRRDDK